MIRNRMVVAVVCLALAAATGALAQRSQQEKPTGPHPTIAVEETMVDLGRVFQRDQYRHVFVVRNTGSADLVIDNVKPG